MGRLECTICGGVIEKPTFNEAADALDHGIGLTKGRPCPNDGQHLVWNGKPVDPRNTPRDNPPKVISGTTGGHTYSAKFSGTTTDTSSHLLTSGDTPTAPKKQQTKKTKTPAPKKRR